MKLDNYRFMFYKMSSNSLFLVCVRTVIVAEGFTGRCKQQYEGGRDQGKEKYAAYVKRTRAGKNFLF